MPPQKSVNERKNLIRGISNLKERVKLIEDFLNEPHEIQEEGDTYFIEGEFTEYVKSKSKVLLGGK